LTAQTLHSVEIQLPNLAVANKFLDEKFAEEKAASYDMELVINSTKNSGVIYDNLAHYLFNQLIKAHDSHVVDRPLRFSYLSRLAASGALAEFRCGHLTD